MIPLYYDETHTKGWYFRINGKELRFVSKLAAILWAQIHL